MDAKSLDRALARKLPRPAELAGKIAGKPRLVEQLVRGLRAETATVRFNSSKLLLALAESSPGALRPWIGSLLELLDSENKLLKSAAMRMLGRLAAVDSTGRITRAIDRILAPIPGPDLVVACNAISESARIAGAKPRLKARVVEALCSVGRGRYRTPTCRNIAIGTAIDALGGLELGVSHRAAVERFVRRQLKNPRKSTRSRAERYLRRGGAAGGRRVGRKSSGGVPAHRRGGRDRSS
jgi:hypothetical protein